MINLDEILTRGQIAFALLVIAFLLYMIFLVKFPDESSKRHR